MLQDEERSREGLAQWDEAGQVRGPGKVLRDWFRVVIAVGPVGSRKNLRVTMKDGRSVSGSGGRCEEHLFP